MVRGFLILLVILIPVLAKTEPNSAMKIAGQIGLVSGKVSVDESDVKKGTKVKIGAVIEVGSGSKATLILGKGSVFQLAENSRVVVSEYGVTPEREELAKIDLKFGKTRALILNQGPKRELKIRTRAATMGVRGTEIFIDVPEDSAKPVQFVTVEGLADLQIGEAGAVIPLPQNQSVAFNAPSDSKAGASESPKALTAEQVSTTLSEGGLPPPPPRTEDAPVLPPPPPGATRGQGGGLSDGFAIGPTAPVTLDPIQDRIYRPLVLPQFCNANLGVCP